MNYQAIEVVAGKDCNCALSKLAGKRLLYNDVLDLFTNSRCSCTFKHYKDRRHIGDKRRFGIVQPIPNHQSRAKPYGRRVVDIHNRARDRFAERRMEEAFVALQQAG